MSFWKFSLLFFCLYIINTPISTGQLRNTDRKSGDRDIRITNIPDTAAIEAQILYATNLNKEAIDSAIYLYKDAALKARQINYSDGIIMALAGVGACYSRKGMYDLSILYFRQGLPFTATCRDKYKLGFYYSAMAIPWLNKGITDSATYYSYKGLYIIQEDKKHLWENKDKALIIYANAGSVWQELESWDYSLTFYRKALVLSLGDNDSATANMLYNNIGSNYASQWKWDSAKRYLQLALAYGEREKNRGWFIASTNLARAYIHLKKPEEAIRLVKTIEPYLHLIPYDKQVHVGSMVALGESYYIMQQYDAAEKTLKKTAAVAADYASGTYDAYNVLAKLYYETGKYQQAYDYLQKSMPLKDSLIQKQRTNTIYELEAKYQATEKNNNIIQQQLLLANKENQLQRKNIWIGVISFITIIVAGALYAYDRHKQKLQAEKMNALKKEQQITSLKSTIEGEEKERSRVGRELHDGIMIQLSALKMNLTALPESHKDLAQTDYYKQLIKQLEGTTKELRQIAHNLMPDMLLEGGLADAVYYFCRNQPPNTSLKIDYQQYGEIPRMQPEFELIVYRIIQELVQNIYKHANASLATVQLLNYQDDVLAITIEDNGIGFSEEDIKDKNGMGFKSLRSRLQALNGIMNLQSSAATGTTVYLEFDLHTIKNLPNNNGHVYKSSNNG